MAETVGDFFDRVVQGAQPEFRAAPWYNADGDCIHYHWRDDEFHAEWLDDKVTIYRSLTTGEAVGFEIKGVGALVKKLGEFGISLTECDGTPLALFMFVSQTTGSSNYPASERAELYRYLIEQVAKQKVEIDQSAVA